MDRIVGSEVRPGTMAPAESNSLTTSGCPPLMASTMGVHPVAESTTHAYQLTFFSSDHGDRLTYLASRCPLIYGSRPL